MATLFQRNPVASHGLVVVFPDQDASIWDSEINGLVEAVERSIDGACVTLALVNGRQPSLAPTRWRTGLSR